MIHDAPTFLRGTGQRLIVAHLAHLPGQELPNLGCCLFWQWGTFRTTSATCTGMGVVRQCCCKATEVCLVLEGNRKGPRAWEIWRWWKGHKAGTQDLPVIGFHRFSSPSRMEGGAIVVVSPGLGQGVNKFQLHYIESISGILKIVQEWSGWNNQLKIRQTLQTLSSNPSSSWRRAGSDKTSNASWTSLNFWAASSARSTFLHFGQVHNKALWTALCVAFSFHFTPKFGKVTCKTQHQKWCSTCCRMLPWILSGCHFRAIFRYAFLMSAAEAPKSMPRMA